MYWKENNMSFLEKFWPPKKELFTRPFITFLKRQVIKILYKQFVANSPIFSVYNKYLD